MERFIFFSVAIVIFIIVILGTFLLGKLMDGGTSSDDLSTQWILSSLLSMVFIMVFLVQKGLL